MATHEQHQSPSDELILETLAGHSEAVREIFLAAHHLILETLPGTNFTMDMVDGAIGYGVHQYGADGWGVGALMPQKRWVNLAFMRGAHLPDPQGLMEGTGKSLRHVKFRRLGDVNDRAEAVKDLIAAATQGQ